MAALPSRAAAVVAAIAVPLLVVAAGEVRAQERLLGTRAVGGGPVFEMWSFGDGVPQRVGNDSVLVSRASQLSLPFMAVVPLGSRWAFDVMGAYAHGSVTLEGDDPSLERDSYSLSGITDVKVRAVGHIVPDALLLTVGATLPTGKTELDAEELAALRVLAAPALRFHTPALGSGSGVTVGLVYARPVGEWAWAFGASYELRGEYTPIAAVQAGVGSPDFSPGDVIRLSLGLDGFLGENGMTLSLAADIYGENELTVGDEEGGRNRFGVQLGPIYTAEWQLRLASRSWRELSVFVLDRYRSSFEQDGSTVSGSSGNELELGVRGVRPLTRNVGLLLGLDGRHHTGLKIDETLATAAIAGGGATVGLSVGRGMYELQPFARAQFGRIDAGGAAVNATAVGAGVTLSARF